MRNEDELLQLISDANDFGLVCRGVVPLNSDEHSLHVSHDATVLLFLFGHVGGSIWNAFEDSSEYSDGLPDPMNRWSARIAEMLASKYGGEAKLPFGGPPYQPFLDWARRAENLNHSKMGMLIHPTHGLWHAYRFALMVPAGLSQYGESSCLASQINPQTERGEDICAQCDSQPCLTACPVSAFEQGQYDVESCYRHLVKNDREIACRDDGCHARLACPVGFQSKYPGAQSRFHIRQFMVAQSKVFD
ncbi:MAG: hypothetical protein AAF402_04395 [Pseudomonadota bacterium]